MKKEFLQDFMTLDSVTEGVLRLQGGVLSFFAFNEQHAFAADQVTIAIDFGTIAVKHGERTYRFTRGVSEPDAHRNLLLTPPVRSALVTRKVLEASMSVHRNELLAFYDQDKLTNEVWATVLAASGYNVSYKLGILSPASLKSRTLILVAASATVLGILLAIVIRFVIS